MDTIYSDPFPHIVIDNFLPKDQFIELRNSINQTQYDYIGKPTFVQKKVGVAYKSIDDQLKNIVELLCSESILRKIATLSGIDHKKLIGLGDIENFAGYSPYHITPSGGFLGSHVDHSQIKTEGKTFFHVANSIFYISENWQENWGGETALFSRSGLRIKKLVEPKPNRLIMFLHSATSFHGVVKYSECANSPRETIYNDYYINDKDIPEYLISLKSKWKKEYILSSHCTTPIPIVRFGLKHFLRNFYKIKFLKELKIAKSMMYKHYGFYLFNKLLKRRSDWIR